MHYSSFSLDTSGENILESLVNEGLVEVRKTGIRIECVCVFVFLSFFLCRF